MLTRTWTARVQTRLSRQIVRCDLKQLFQLHPSFHLQIKRSIYLSAYLTNIYPIYPSN